jgi:hypothetical protein
MLVKSKKKQKQRKLLDPTFPAQFFSLLLFISPIILFGLLETIMLSQHENIFVNDILCDWMGFITF